MTNNLAFLPVLEADLRQLCNDARRSEGFVGWLSGPEHPEIKEAAERALNKLRQCEGKSDSLELLKGDEDMLRPFLAACEVKSSKLISVALVSVQKLLANNFVKVEGVVAIVTALEQVENVGEEGVRLKVLQSALTLFQSPGTYQDQEQIRRTLGVCFRLLSNGRNSDSVLNTAAATVRQAVALVFDHVVTAADGSPPRGGSIAFGSNNSEQGTAALKLLDDLCLLAVGQEAQWVRTPAIPSVFVLDVLDFVLSNSTAVFATIPEFEHALLVRICQLLVNQLQELMDKSKPDAGDSNELRVVLRMVRTVVRNFYRQLKAKCGVFIETLLEGVAPQRPLLQRVLIMQVFRSWCGDTDKLQFLFETYDMRRDCKLKAVEYMMRCFADTIESTLRLAGEFMEDDPVAMLANLYHMRLNGKSWTLDMDFASGPSDVALGYLTMLAIDCLLNCVAAAEKLTDRALEPDIRQREAIASGGPSPPEASADMAAALVRATWKLMLQALSKLLSRCSDEALVLQLLRGYQAMTQSCGLLGLAHARDAFLSSLTEYAFAPAASPRHAPPASPPAAEPPASGEGAAAAPDEVGGGRYAGAGDGLASPPPGRAGGVGGQEGDGGQVLTPKNVHVLRTLFNIAARLQASLGPSWCLILDTLNALDRCLSSPHTTTQDLSSDPSRASELAILATAANQLFASTASMGDAAATDLLAALRQVSRRAAPCVAVTPGSLPRLYALQRMAQVLEHNMQRLPPMWEVFSGHIVELCTSAQRPPVRAAALETLGKATSRLLSLSHAASCAAEPLSRAAAGGEGGEGAVEVMLLSVLQRCYDESRDPDVQVGVLRVGMTVLQHHGEHMSGGWSPLLRLLETVAGSEDVEGVRAGFHAMQLVASDYLAVMPFPLMRRALEVSALYGSQQRDLNISLTTISLLWNAADVIGRSYQDGGAAPAAGTLSPTTSGVNMDDSGDEDGSTPVSLSVEQYTQILGVLFDALQALCIDTRPEVRNSGVRTLFSVVSTAGRRMGWGMWEDVMWNILFPLLRNVHHMAATSSREEAEGATLGRGVKMLVHHSRNSQQKQWDETLVLAINGMAKLFKAHMGTVSQLEGMDVGWQELMLVVESSMAGGRKETALAAVGLVHTVLMAHAGSQWLSTAMWKRALRALDVGIEAATSPTCMVPLAARLELVNTIHQLYMQHRACFDAGDLRQLFMWVEKFGRNPCSVEDATSVLPGSLPAVQRQVLAMLPAMAPVPIVEVWHDLLSTLLRLLRPHLLEGPREAHRGSSVSSALQHIAFSSEAQQRVLRVLLHVFEEQVPWQVKAREFARVVGSVGRCMALRFTAYRDALWRSAVAGFVAVVSSGLPVLNSAAAEDREMFEEGWGALAEALEAFLLGSLMSKEQACTAAAAQDHAANAVEAHAAGGSGDAGMISTPRGAGSSEAEARDEEAARADGELEASVLDALTDTALTACSLTSASMRARLIRVLDTAAVRPRHLNLPQVPGVSRFSHQCMRKMYVLCSRGAQTQVPCTLEVAQLALPVLLGRCNATLRGYAAAQQRVDEGSGQAGDAPTLDEVLCVLEMAATMTLTPPVANAALAACAGAAPLVELLRESRGGQPRGPRERTHLLLLYHALCECVTVRDERVREMVRDVLQLAGVELGLVGSQL